MHADRSLMLVGPCAWPEEIGDERARRKKHEDVRLERTAHQLRCSISLGAPLMLSNWVLLPFRGDVYIP